MKLLRAIGVLLAAGAVLIALAGSAGAGFVLAATSHISPSKVELDTTALFWNHSQGLPLSTLCGSSANPGAGGFQNGATADNYLLWLFSTDGGNANGEPQGGSGLGGPGAPTLTIGSTTYADAFFTGGVWQIVTPGLDPSGIASANTNFTVKDTGNGDWILTLSHGCVGQQSSSSSSSSSAQTSFSSSQSGQSSSSGSSSAQSSSSAETSFSSNQSGESSSSASSSAQTSFSGNQSGESSSSARSSASHTLPQTSTFGNSSGPTDHTWMLVAAGGMLLGSLLILAPARIKKRR